MSKLDNVMDMIEQYYLDPYVKTPGGKAEAKQQIKDLMLELIQEAWDKDLSTKQLMQKIREL